MQTIYLPEQLQNTDNIIRLPTLLHEAVNAEYLKPQLDTNMTKYQWLRTQPYDVQREEGLRILRDFTFSSRGNATNCSGVHHGNRRIDRRLGAKLDKWFVENRATFASDDRRNRATRCLAGSLWPGSSIA